MTKDRLTDEIDLLASNFSIMVDKVYQREQTLRRQVEALKIEIDEAKRTQQVSEIVDTDFFRDLQAKADHMRSRRKRDPGRQRLPHGASNPSRNLSCLYRQGVLAVFVPIQTLMLLVFLPAIQCGLTPGRQRHGENDKPRFALQ